MKVEEQTEEAPNVRVSVIIPCEGRACLADCLKSVADCGGVEGGYEVLVVGVLPETLTLEPPVRFVASEEKTPAALRNVGARMAKGQILLFTDSDCLVDRGWMAKAAESCSGEDRLLVIGGIRFPRGSLIDTGDNLALYSMVHVSQRGGRAEGWRCGANNLAVQRWTFGDLGGFDPQLPCGEGADLLMRAELASCSVWFDPRFAVRHQSHRRTLREVTQHARHYAACTVLRLLSREGRWKPWRLDHALRGLLPVAWLWCVLSATVRILLMVAGNPVFLGFALSLPWTWWFHYQWRMSVYRQYSQAIRGRR